MLWKIASKDWVSMCRLTHGRWRFLGHPSALEFARSEMSFRFLLLHVQHRQISSGTSADRVLEVHGAVKWLQCSKPCCPDVWKAPADLCLAEDPHTHRVQGVLPCCPKCKAVARPNVQMFGGDSGFSRARRGAQNTRYDAWVNSLASRPDVSSLSVVCLEVGCGLTVPTVRRELEKVVQRFPGGRLVRVNPENPGLAKELVEKGVSLPLPAAAAIEKLSQQVAQTEEIMQAGRQKRSVPMDMYQEFREPLSQCLPEVFFGLQEVKIGDGTKLEVTAIIRVMAKFSGGSSTVGGWSLNASLATRVDQAAPSCR
eukprot:s3114_g2.t1